MRMLLLTCVLLCGCGAKAPPAQAPKCESHNSCPLKKPTKRDKVFDYMVWGPSSLGWDD